jgi:hypothetical protein
MRDFEPAYVGSGVRLGRSGMSALSPFYPPTSDIGRRRRHGSSVPILFSSSGFPCQALHNLPGHCSLRSRVMPSA